MIISLTIDEAIALVVAGEAVRLQYELDGDDLEGDAYKALKSAVYHMNQQLWTKREANAAE